MFSSLVTPIIMYASEVTGYNECEGYERILRRYIKWTLGLPRGTRTAVIQSETGCPPLSIPRLIRAARYEASQPKRVSMLTREALTEARATEKWLARERRWNKLGWATQEVAARLGDEGFIEAVKRRALDQFQQERQAKVDKLEWYLVPRSCPPPYLKKVNKDMKLIARFRCGAESRSTESWRVENSCRMCGMTTETAEHMMECIGERRYRWRVLLAEDGGGVDWMKTIISIRAANTVDGRNC